MKNLEGKVAIITGASRGVGEYMAVEFAKEGCNVVVAARTEAEGQSRLEGTIGETARELEKLGVRALPVRCDVTDDDQIEEMVRRTMSEFGRIDILVNNAGIMAPAKLVDMPLKRWDLMWRVNVRGAIACSKAVLPHMIARNDGVIFNISSIAADQEGAGNISYMLTKHALRELAKGLAAEEKEHNIRAFALSPLGWVPTPGTLFYRLDETMPSVGPMLERPEAMGLA
ncbi:MAG TPA: SDR family NAD(P)-dependent oxidoreductase, partial [Dehalococcoidia bacterium]|nr:SDR family NAD(P)-dependent oxidoreductase [Dehalococcoidia bacterium]